MAQTKISSSRQLTIDNHLAMNDKKITGLSAGTADTDAVNKAQLDAATSGMSAGLMTPVQNLTQLESVTVTGANDKYLINVEDSGMYRLDWESEAQEDGNFVITPDNVGTGAGRWIKMSNQLQDHNSASGIQGGATTEYYHLDAAQHTVVTRNASASQSGVLSSADWATFNSKQAALGFTPENVANKGVASGYASLNAQSKVVQDPANATATPTAAKIPIADGNGTLNSWVTGNMTGKNFIIRETPTGSKNGTNKDFALVNTPASGTDCVFLNGILQEPGTGNDYTIATNIISFTVAPVVTDKIFVNYWK
jgi:hypothetical protein